MRIAFNASHRYTFNELVPLYLRLSPGGEDPALVDSDGQVPSAISLR